MSPEGTDGQPRSLAEQVEIYRRCGVWTHPPGPDIEASLKLLAALETIYGFDIDESELRQLGEQLKEYYEQLAERMATIADQESSTNHDYPEDRMYM